MQDKNSHKHKIQEPIAIIGMGCRFPGNINNPEEFWKAICNGVDGITEVPNDRWDLKSFYHPDRNKKGKIYTKRGGFLNNIDLFDPQFFGISPREASSLDPQQRLLLETTWEALEDAGIPPENLSGEKVGVYIGLFMHDYENIHTQPSEHQIIGTHSATGISTTISANRISYTFNFKGPSMIVDTACSSSLVAVHLACQSLLNGESNVALAGGVNLILRPEMTISLSKGSFLSEDGACKSFDSRANGYVRSEGVGVVAFKRLSDAIADNDPIYALVRGTAVNHDGKSNGITVPDMNAQIEGLREAVNKAGIRPEEVDYVEAHGTGTPVGDPIETEAIGTVFSANRPTDDPCIIGSIKSNIGHTESSAGIAGLMKAALVVRNGVIPGNLHFENPNPQIPFEKLKLKVPTETQAWPEKKGVSRYAGINSFGFGGTNAHAIVECFESSIYASPKKNETNEDSNEKNYLIPISAFSSEGVKEQAKALNTFLNETENSPKNIADIAYTLALHKSHHPFRLSVVAQNISELKENLNAFISNEKRNDISNGQIIQQHKTAFIFSGMGSQWLGMGCQLLKKEPVFRDTIEKCDKLFQEFTNEWSIIEELTATEENSRINQTQITQPCLFSVQVAMFELWKSWGIIPDAIVGHSVGEMAACYATGVLSLKDLVKVCYHRSRLQATTAGTGSMLAVGITEERLKERVPQLLDKVSIAAINSTESITLSGNTEVLNEIEKILVGEDIFARFLKVEVPYHSAYMEPILDELRNSLEGIHPKTATIPLISTVTGLPIEGEQITPEYWTKNVRQPVLFAKAVSTLIDLGTDIFLETGAHPVLTTSIKECLSEKGSKGITIASMRRNEPDDKIMLSALGQLYIAGYPFDWKNIFKNTGNFIKLPSYQWIRDHYWMETEESKQIRLGKRGGSASGLLGKQVHPLLGSKVEAPGNIWNLTIDINDIDFLKDHVVQGNIVFPAAAYMECGLAAGKQLFPDKKTYIQQINIKNPLIFEPEKKVHLQLSVDAKNQFSIHSKLVNEKQEWTLHCQGIIAAGLDEMQQEQINIAEIKKRFSETAIEQTACYSSLSQKGLEYGPSFQAINSLQVSNNEILAQLSIPVQLKNEIETFSIHPAILDSTFQAMASVELNGTYLPVMLEELKVYSKLTEKMFCFCSFTEPQHQLVKGNIQLFNESGQLLAEAKQLHCKLIDGTQDETADSLENILYNTVWEEEIHPSLTYPQSRNTGFPSPVILREKLAPVIKHLAKEQNRDQHQRIVSLLDNLSIQYIVDALISLGFDFVPGKQFTTNDLLNSLGIVIEQDHMLKWTLQLLQSAKLLKQKDEIWEVIAKPELVNTNQVWLEYFNKYPAYQAELSLIRNCGLELKDVLTGKQNASTVLSGGSRNTILEHLYQNSPTYCMYHSHMQKIVELITSQYFRNKKISILEIGANNGALTSYLLPTLSANKVSYCYSVTSESAIEIAKKQFSSYPFVEYKTIDFENELDSQGFTKQSFDILIISDLESIKQNDGYLLEKLADLVVENGYLIQNKQTNSPLWLNFTTGFQSEYQTDDKLEISDIKTINEPKLWNNISEINNEIDSFNSIVVAQKADIGDTTEGKLEDNNNLFSNHKACIIFTDNSPVAKSITTHCQSVEIPVFLVHKGNSFQLNNDLHVEMDANNAQHYHELLNHVKIDLKQPPLIIDFWHQIEQGTNISSNYLNKNLDEQCMHFIYLLQALVSNEWNTAPTLWTVTNGMEAIEKEDIHRPQLAPLMGISRVAISEYSSISIKMADLGHVPNDKETELLWNEITNVSNEDELAFRNDKRYVRRVQRNNNLNQLNSANNAIALSKKSKGINNFSFIETKQPQPAPDEIVIKVMAAGLNFKDLAKISGLLDDFMLDENRKDTLGMECSGIVTAVGENITRFAIGDRVMGLSKDCFSSHIICLPNNMTQIPDHISFNEAAGIPVTFLSVHYALNKMVNFGKGATILIHTATGGVGLAAIQVAKMKGWKILATAGTPDKRSLLKSIGIEYVGNSRTDKFVDEVMEFTNHKGVDIILNTLPANMVAKSMSILKEMKGHFIDFTNFYQQDLTISALNKGITFHTFDLEELRIKYPETGIELWKEIVQHFEDYDYRPLPYRAFPFSQISEAFHYMRKGVHTGKIVLSTNNDVLNPVPEKAELSVDKNGTYIITGGLGGFGMATAKWLARNGAGQLILLGRKGAVTKEAIDGVKEIEATGTKVLVEKVDISQNDQLKAIIENLGTNLPLKGIVHSAMVLQDTPISQMDKEKFSKVMAPKVMGAWNLHLLTQNIDIDFFIMYSSAMSITGNEDQSNYSAANLFLNSLAKYRKQNGLKALSVLWGAMGEVGYVAQHSEIKDHFARQGVHQVSMEQAWKSMVYGVEKDLDELIVLPVEWDVLARYSNSVGNSPKFTSLIKDGASSQGSTSEKEDTISLINNQSPEERKRYLTEQLTKEVASVLGVPVEKMDADQALSNLGFDSLMAVELVASIKKVSNVTLPKMTLLKAGLNVEELVEIVEKNIVKTSEPQTKQNSTKEGKSGKWTICENPKPDAKIRLFCFPYLGGGASTFNGWSHAMPDDVEVFAIQLPGREERSSEPALTDMNDAIKELTSQLLPLFDKPFIFYGHSFGARMAIHFAAELKNKHGIAPEHIFTGSFTSPGFFDEFIPKDGNLDSSLVPDEIVLKILQKLKTSVEITGNKTLMKELMPVYKADILMGMKLLFKHENQKTIEVPAPMTLFTGEKDQLELVKNITDWNEFTASNWKHETVPGGHLFINEDTNKHIFFEILSNYINEILEHVSTNSKLEVEAAVNDLTDEEVEELLKLALSDDEEKTD